MEELNTNEDNIKESIEFEPILKTDLIESQLDKIRSQIENVFSFSSFDSQSSLPKSLASDADGIMGGYSQVQAQTNSLVKGAQETINTFASIPDTASREFDHYSSTAKGSNIFAPFGAGFDYSSPEYRSDYKARHMKSLGDSAGETIGDVGLIGGSFATGAAGGAIAGAMGMGIGALATGGIGLGIGLAADAVLGSGVEKSRAMRKMTGGFQDMARDYGIGLGKNDAEILTNEIYDYSNTYDAISQDITVDEMSSNIQTFAGAGGFSKIKDTGEFKESIRAVIDDTREISKALGVFQDEAVSMMAELQSKGLSSAASAKDFLYELQGQGVQSGVGTAELYQSGMNAMGTFKGTSYGGSNAFNAGVDSRMLTAEIGHTDPYLMGLLGGEEQAAQTLLSNTVRGSNKFMGLQKYGIAGGNGFSTDMIGMIQGGVDFFANEGIPGMFEQNGREMEHIGKMSIQTQSQNLVNTSLDYMNMTLGNIGKDANGRRSEDMTTGMMMDFLGMSRPEAELQLRAATANPFVRRASADVAGLSSSLKSDDPGLFGYIASTVKSDFAWVGEQIDTLGQGYDSGAHSIGRGFRNIGDAIFGIDRIDINDIASGGIYNAFKNNIDIEMKTEIEENEKVKAARADLIEKGKAINGTLDIDIFSSDVTSDMTKFFNEKVGSSGKYDILMKNLEGMSDPEEMKKVMEHTLNTEFSNEDFTKIVTVEQDLKKQISDSKIMLPYKQASHKLEREKRTARINMREEQEAIFSDIKTNRREDLWRNIAREGLDINLGGDNNYYRGAIIGADSSMERYNEAELVANLQKTSMGEESIAKVVAGYNVTYGKDNVGRSELLDTRAKIEEHFKDEYGGANAVNLSRAVDVAMQAVKTTGKFLGDSDSIDDYVNELSTDLMIDFGDVISDSTTAEKAAALKQSIKLNNFSEKEKRSDFATPATTAELAAVENARMMEQVFNPGLQALQVVIKAVI